MTMEDRISRLMEQLEGLLQGTLESLPTIRSQIEELVRQAFAQSMPAPDRGLSSLLRSLGEIDASTTQRKIIHSLLTACDAHKARSALIIPGSPESEVWVGPGLGLGSAEPAGSKTMKLTIPQNSVAGRVMSSQETLSTTFEEGAADSLIYQIIGAPSPAWLAAIPMFVHAGARAVLLVDSREGPLDELDAISFMTKFAGMKINLLLLQKHFESTTQQAATTQGAGIEPVSSEEPSLVIDEVEPSEAETSAPASTVATPETGGVETDVEIELEVADITVAEESLTDGPVFGGTEDYAIESDLSEPVESSPAEKTPSLEPPADLLEASEAPLQEETRESTAVVPDHALERYDLSGYEGEVLEKHEKAIRFARLLISEIKLYNEEAVELGRQNGDLANRLRDDIRRSRILYKERISEDIRGKSNYFSDELVRILADGDPSLLGT